MEERTRPIGLIAGAGRLPNVVADGIRAAGYEVACVGLWGTHEPDLVDHCDDFTTAGVARLNAWIRKLRRFGVEEAIMVGRVRKGRLYDPFYLLKQVPDWRAARVFLYRVGHDRRTQNLLAAVADELEDGGVRLIDSTRFIQDQLADLGRLGRHAPAAARIHDVEFAMPIIRQITRLDIGQSIAVKAGDVVAVEAIEGTDAMIRRAGELCPSGGWTLVKMANPEHDMRFDVPTVGIQTLERLKAARCDCLAVQAGKVILLEREIFLETADRLGISVIGVDFDRPVDVEPGARAAGLESASPEHEGLDPAAELDELVGSRSGLDLRQDRPLDDRPPQDDRLA